MGSSLDFNGALSGVFMRVLRLREVWHSSKAATPQKAGTIRLNLVAKSTINMMARRAECLCHTLRRVSSISARPVTPAW